MASLAILIDVGETSTLVNIWPTVTFTLLVTLNPPGYWIVTRNVYTPALENVTVVLFPAFVPFAVENVGAVAPAGTVVANQV